MSDKKTSEIIIQPGRSIFRLDWQDIWNHRDLLYFLVRRDFVSHYKQTILGPLWFIIQPLLTTVIFTIVFEKAARLSTDGLPPTLFYFSGLVIWGYFSQCFSSTAQSFIANAHLFEKVYFPRLIVPLAIIASNLPTFLIQLVTFLGFYFYFLLFTPAAAFIHPSIYVLLIPALLTIAAALSLGFGLSVASLTVKYRDFHHAIGFLIQLWLYATPVIYPISVIPQRWRFVAAINPMTGVVECFRFVFFGTEVFHFKYLWFSAICSLAVLIAGILLFNKAERNFVDTI